MTWVKTLATVAALAAAFLLAPPAASAAEKAPEKTRQRAPAKAPPKKAPAAPESIGSATMKEDGTLVLMLRATDGAGAVGDARLTYPRSHPEYARILEHLGGLKPGESKPVPRFP